MCYPDDTMATKRKPAKRKKQATGPVKFSVPLPPEVHHDLAIASVHSGLSNSTLIRDLVAARLTAGLDTRLRSLAPQNPRQSDWKRVSVFLPCDVKEQATEIVRQQHGSTEDRRYSGSLAGAIAALVAERYSPGYSF